MPGVEPAFPDWICDEASSCLMQDAVDCDVALRLRLSRAFVLAAVDADADQVTRSVPA